MRRENTEERTRLNLRFIVTDEDPLQIKQYNCLGFCAGFRVFWEFPAYRRTDAEWAKLSNESKRAKFLKTPTGKAYLNSIGPHFMERMKYERFSAEPTKGPVIVMYRGNDLGPHVAKRLREGRPWYEGKCGSDYRIVHRLKDMKLKYGEITGFWVPTNETSQKWKDEIDKRTKAGRLAVAPILDSQETDGDFLWKMIAALEEEEAQ